MLTSPQRIPTHVPGFVLLMTLVILALAACAMARLANRSLSAVRRGTLAQQQLQERWLVTTCRQAVLDRSESILAAVEKEQQATGLGWPYPGELELGFSIADRRVALRLADEDAKVNLNTIHRRQPEQLHGLLAQAAVTGSIPIRLRSRTGDTKLRRPAFSGWGQVVHRSGILSHDGGWEQLDPITGQFTCWGKGKLNLKRASDDAVRIMLDRALKPQQVEDLISLRLGYVGELDRLFESLDLTRRELIGLKPLVADRSSAYSLQVSIESVRGRIERLLVHDPTDRLSPEVLIFDW